MRSACRKSQRSIKKELQDGVLGQVLGISNEYATTQLEERRDEDELFFDSRKERTKRRRKTLGSKSGRHGQAQDNEREGGFVEGKQASVVVAVGRYRRSWTNCLGPASEQSNVGLVMVQKPLHALHVGYLYLALDCTPSMPHASAGAGVYSGDSRSRCNLAHGRGIAPMRGKKGRFRQNGICAQKLVSP